MAAGVATGGFGVAVVGLQDLRRDIRTAGNRALPNELRKLNREIAREGRDAARQNARGLKGGRRFAATIGSRGSARAATIAVNIRRHPAAPGWLFGSFGGRRTRQFHQPWLGNARTGNLGRAYAVTPAIRALEPEWAETYGKRIQLALDRALGT